MRFQTFEAADPLTQYVYVSLPPFEICPYLLEPNDQPPCTLSLNTPRTFVMRSFTRKN